MSSGTPQLPDHLRGLADELQQVIAAAERGRHLIHHAAGRADDEVLHLLREQRDRRGRSGSRPPAAPPLPAWPPPAPRTSSSPCRPAPPTRPAAAARAGAACRARRGERRARRRRRLPRRAGDRRSAGRGRARTVSGRSGTMSASGSVTVASPPSARMSHALDHDLRFVARLRRHPGRGGDRHLQHQRAGVVGDAAHDVEPSRRACDGEGTTGRRTRRPAPTPARGGSRAAPPANSSPASTSASASARGRRPRARSAARSAGSTCARIASLA